ncbi:hypothetical protein [Paenibacillus dendritiformis]|nr:hypothetical protein [Paenibacillus dendritiformis]CAH8768975.1 hypothetical protein H7S4_001673 [Paenibacillus dendritiformis]
MVTLPVNGGASGAASSSPLGHPAIANRAGMRYYRGDYIFIQIRVLEESG